MNPSDTNRLMAVVEDALRTAPLAPAPTTLRGGVMRRVRLLSSAPKFAFPWLEAALSLMAATLATSLSYMFLLLPPTTFLRLTQLLRVSVRLPAGRAVLFAGAAGLGMAVLCMFFAVRIFITPRRQTGRILRVR
ncbi:MAG: hypothetical protein JW929_16240 [Anaerolineales bacterium]|nr:hypothetical protein [Anaerolineales bacterium]